MAKRSEIPVVLPPGIKHGSPSTYNNYKCGCLDCKKAWALYNKDRIKRWRQRKRQEKTLLKNANQTFDSMLNT